MRARRKKPALPSREEFLAKIRAEQDKRAGGYRDQALKLFPHVCGKCGREFSGARLRELTVHHKDHNHHNNPPDGSNWELLCVYCHDAEHDNPHERAHYEKDPLSRAPETALGFEAFEGLKGLLGGADADGDQKP